MIEITVPSKIAKRLDGLCGIPDGNPENDLTMSNNLRAKSIPTFASSWQIKSIEDTCQGVQQIDVQNFPFKEATRFCKKMLMDPRFKPCWDVS